MGEGKSTLRDGNVACLRDFDYWGEEQGRDHDTGAWAAEWDTAGSWSWSWSGRRAHGSVAEAHISYGSIANSLFGEILSW